MRDIHELVQSLVSRMGTLELSRYKLAEQVGERMGISQAAADRRLQRLLKDGSKDLDFNFIVLVCDLLSFKLVLENQ